MRSLVNATAALLLVGLGMGACGPSEDPPSRPVEPAQVPDGAKVVAAAGDISCDPADSDFDGADPEQCQQRATADLLVDADAVIPLGDLQYPDGTLETFQQAYDATWGKFAEESYPTPGNHEYHLPGAEGYFDYWASKGRPGATGGGFYSWDLGSWHLISLNSNCDEVPCEEGSAQNDFLEEDLARTDRSCILAYWHQPVFNSGEQHGDSAPSGAKAFWEDLSAVGADIVVNGHEHNYQRYGKQDVSGQALPDGIREFVVGSGGKSHYSLLDEKDPNYEAGNATDFGVLLLHLGDDSYSWEFVNVEGDVLDAGGPVACN